MNCCFKMWLENDFCGTQLGNAETLLIYMVNDLLNQKINVPISKVVDSYV